MDNSNQNSVTLEVIRAEQFGTKLYIGAAPAQELIKITTIDRYDPKLEPTDPRQGYQRPPERSRITKIGKYLMENGDKKLFPTAVLLASRYVLDFDRKTSTITISYNTPLQIVDGQHRIEGLKYVILEKEHDKLKNLPIPFVIIETPDKLTEMDQFRIINGTAKSVRTDLVNLILSKIYAEAKPIDIPEKERWKVVISRVVDRLDKDPASPWYRCISLPGEPTTKDENTKFLRGTSLITSLKPVYIWLKDTIMENYCKSLDDEVEFCYNIVKEYWSALKELLPEAFNNPQQYVLQKTPGIFSLHKLLKLLLGILYRGHRNFDKKTFIEFLVESPEIKDPDFWDSKQKRASVYGSMKGFEELYEIISEPYKK